MLHESKANEIIQKYLSIDHKITEHDIATFKVIDYWVKNNNRIDNIDEQPLYVESTIANYQTKKLVEYMPEAQLIYITEPFYDCIQQILKLYYTTFI